MALSSKTIYKYFIFTSREKTEVAAYRNSIYSIYSIYSILRSHDNLRRAPHEGSPSTIATIATVDTIDTIAIIAQLLYFVMPKSFPDSQLQYRAAEDSEDSDIESSLGSESEDNVARATGESTQIGTKEDPINRPTSVQGTTAPFLS